MLRLLAERHPGRIGLFDESLVRNQDDELNLRLTRAGGKIWQSPRTSATTTLGLVPSLFTNISSTASVAVVRKHRIPASWRICPRGLANLVLLLGWAGMGCGPAIGGGLCKDLGGSCRFLRACFVLAAVLAAARHGWVILPIMPYLCHHPLFLRSGFWREPCTADGIVRFKLPKLFGDYSVSILNGNGFGEC